MKVCVLSGSNYTVNGYPERLIEVDSDIRGTTSAISKKGMAELLYELYLEAVKKYGGSVRFMWDCDDTSGHYRTWIPRKPDSFNHPKALNEKLND